MQMVVISLLGSHFFLSQILFFVKKKKYTMFHFDPITVTPWSLSTCAVGV